MDPTEWHVALSKFGIPRIPNAIVRREHLIDRLENAAQALTLVAAAPGSGKTALLSQWVEGLDCPVAWLSCDADDKDPACFWHDLSTAVDHAWRPHGSIDAGLFSEWGSRSLAVELANELGRLDRSGVIIVDDFHLAGADPEVMSAFITALPSGVRLVLGTRSDPSFPMARMRVQGSLLELRQRDLQFSDAETRDVLAALGVTLQEDELQQIESMTEGWAAAVQLAGLSLLADSNRAALLQDMLTTDRSLVDFLVNEVIDRQPPDVRDFLLGTAHTSTFDAELCRAICGDAGPALLERVRSANLFLVELPGPGHQYRYHVLFAQFLRGRLAATDPDRVRAVHRAAAQAYRDRGQPLSAIWHRMQTGDADGAFDDLRTYLTAMISLDDSTVAMAAARGLLADFGIAQLQRSPIKVLDCVIALNTLGGSAAETERWLRRVDAIADTLDHSAQYLLEGAWSFYYMHQGDVEACLERAQRALRLQEQAPVESEWSDALPNMFAQSRLWLGDPDGVLAAVDLLHRSRTHPVASEVRGPGFASYALAVRGDLTRAHGQASSALEAAARLGLGEHNFGRAEPELTLAVLAMEADRLAEAQRHIDAAMRIAEGGRRPPIEVLAHLHQAQLDVARGESHAAGERVRRARQVWSDAGDAALARIDEMAARVALDCGETPAAAAIHSRLPSGPAADLLAARIALAQGQADAARRLLGAMDTPSGPRMALEHCLLLALATTDIDRGAAHAALASALDIGQSAGFQMTIVREGPPLRDLLNSLPVHENNAVYVRALLDAARHVIPPVRAAVPIGLIEPLSARELTVLRHLASQLDSTEIAATMFVSVNTVRTHVKAIYRKLGVNSRGEAVNRGQALALY